MPIDRDRGHDQGHEPRHSRRAGNVGTDAILQCADAEPQSSPHYVFSRMRTGRGERIGLKSLREGAKDAGLPLPRYKWEPPYLTLTLYRHAVALASDLAGPAGPERLTKDRKVVWEIVSTHESITTRELIERTGFDERKALPGRARSG